MQSNSVTGTQNNVKLQLIYILYTMQGGALKGEFGSTLSEPNLNKENLEKLTGIVLSSLHEILKSPGQTQYENN